jgi:hypothetical protein
LYAESQGHKKYGPSTHNEESFVSSRVVHDRHMIKLFDSCGGGLS